MSRRVEVGDEGTEDGGTEGENEGTVEVEEVRGDEGTEGDEVGGDREGEEEREEEDGKEGVGGGDEGGLPCEAGEAVFPTERSPTGNCRASADAGMRAPSCGVG